MRQGYLTSIAVAATRSGGHFSLGETQKYSAEHSAQKAGASESRRAEACGPVARETDRLLSRERNAIRGLQWNTSRARHGKEAEGLDSSTRTSDSNTIMKLLVKFQRRHFFRKFH